MPGIPFFIVRDDEGNEEEVFIDRLKTEEHFEFFVQCPHCQGFKGLPL